MSETPEAEEEPAAGAKVAMHVAQEVRPLPGRADDRDHQLAHGHVEGTAVEQRRRIRREVGHHEPQRAGGGVGRHGELLGRMNRIGIDVDAEHGEPSLVKPLAEPPDAAAHVEERERRSLRVCGDRLQKTVEMGRRCLAWNSPGIEASPIFA